MFVNTLQKDLTKLAEIAVASGRNARDLLGLDPKVAFLSFSTKGSAVHADDVSAVTDRNAPRAGVKRDRS